MIVRGEMSGGTTGGPLPIAARSAASSAATSVSASFWGKRAGVTSGWGIYGLWGGNLRRSLCQNLRFLEDVFGCGDSGSNIISWWLTSADFRATSLSFSSG